MKLMTAEDLKNLKWGDRVYRFDGYHCRKLRFVGVMPSSENYLIFSEGEYLCHLYISPKDGAFSGDWCSGEYNSTFVGNLMIGYHADRIKSIKRIYLKETEDFLE